MISLSSYFGAYGVLSPELCFVVEDDQTIVGYAIVAADAKEFYRRVRVAWLPELQTKYAELLQSNQSEPNGPSHIKVFKCSFIRVLVTYFITFLEYVFQTAMHAVGQPPE